MLISRVHGGRLTVSRHAHSIHSAFRVKMKSVQDQRAQIPVSKHEREVEYRSCFTQLMKFDM